MLDQLISDISETLTNLRDDDLQTKMKSLLSTYQQSGDESWRKYKFSNPHSYSRNLVHISPLFEAILLVWDKGQISPIHNHNQSNCFFVVMEGNISETQYDFKMDGKKAELTQLGTSSFCAGDVAVVSEGDEILHKVASDLGGQACTLHIYNRPIYKCNIYCPVTGSVECRKPGFYTIYGKLLDSDIMVYKKIYDQLEACDKARALEGTPSEPCSELQLSIKELKLSVELANADRVPSFLDMVDHEEEFSSTNLEGYT